MPVRATKTILDCVNDGVALASMKHPDNPSFEHIVNECVLYGKVLLRATISDDLYRTEILDPSKVQMGGLRIFAR